MGSEMIHHPEHGTTGTDYGKLVDAGFSDRYLSTFYTEIVQDEVQLAEFLAREYLKVQGMPAMLELGCGPCVSRALQAVPHVSEIVLSDFLPDNREAVLRWQNKHPAAHNWSDFTRLALEVEGRDASNESVTAREEALREKIVSVQHLDLLDASPPPNDRKYGVVTAFFCLDSASDSMETWEKVMARAVSLLSPRGNFFASFLYDTDHYTINGTLDGGEDLYQVRLTDVDVRRALEAMGFDRADTVVEVAGNTDMKAHGYDAIIMVSAARDGI
ncbi:guanitoxin biosynthesis pre-guanitoxin forming N-methyltransferase GntF [Micromonospora sp. DT44]|uniref:guanitoxin biosynthesis pre-guanitoxin forming N-methyltransferase GntF n=1 Tax=Micromonospora sp. DT44 TaxID=3393439 RepID=UPI003CF901DA